MEDEESYKIKKIGNDMNYGVNLENGIFSNTYKAINRNLFYQDYLNLIKKIENIAEKEFMIFIRKNQYFFKKIVINDKIIFDSNKLNDCFKIELKSFFESLSINTNKILKNMLLKDSEVESNSLEINMYVLPKFKKNEINFALKDDLIDISIILPNIEKIYIELYKILNESIHISKNDEKNKEQNFEKLNKLFEIHLNDLKKEVKKNEQEEQNQSSNAFPIDLYKLIIREIKKIFLKHIVNYENLSLVLSKFISHLENYFPVLYNKSSKERLDKGNNLTLSNNVEWEQSEQEKLEEALKLYINEKDPKIKFKKISEYVKTKTAKECIERYKYISSLFKKEQENKTLEGKNNKEKIDDKSLIINKKPISTNDYKKSNLINIKHSNENSKLIERDDSIIILLKDDKKTTNGKINENKSLDKTNKSDKQEAIKEKKEESKIKENINKPIDESKSQSNQAINDLANLDTLDLVDQLLNQFDVNYINSNTDANKTSENNPKQILEAFDNNKDTLISIPPANEEYPEDSNEELQVDFEDENSEEAKTYSGSVARFDKFLNFTYNDKVTALHMQTILNLVKFGEKFAIQYSSVKLNRIALPEICEVNFFIKCKKCKMVTFESKFIKISNRLNLFYCATICPKCKCHIQIIFKSELIHVENLQIVGISYSFGAIICDFLTSTFSINCLNCIDYYKKVKFRSGELSHRDRSCPQCQGEMNISTQNLQIVPYSSNNYSFLEDLEINNFKTNTQIIDNQDLNEYVKLYEKKIKSGSPLPENGTCKHYHHSYKWFRFDCCCKYFPCDECHNEISNHESEWAKLILCGFCCFEQNSSNKVCCSCGKGFSRDAGGNGFWEGGKGCRNKATMNSKDAHKFKNSDNKTISRKKMKDKKEKK